MTFIDYYDDFVAALCVWREARGEEYQAKLSVACVLNNRRADPRWPSTLSEVVQQPKQFSSFNAGDPNASKLPRRTHLKDWRAFEECCRAIEESKVKDTIEGANHYHDSSITAPKWTAQMKYVKKIGKLIFYKG